ncbi:MAG TPA: DUF6164 family protein [Luteimonas sp.]|jgi:hypothetical protein|nr:DUF6164 family protein [Luteimonas sp.]
MAKLLLKMRLVPDDEAADVRAMLDAAHVPWYETEPSRWGISHGGIWVRDDEDMPRAKALMAEYQDGRRERARAERAAALRDGTAETFGDVVRREPLRVLLSILGILAALAALALVPFLLHRP